jgi:hypothetical protein
MTGRRQYGNLAIADSKNLAHGCCVKSDRLGEGIHGYESRKSEEQA